MNWLLAAFFEINKKFQPYDQGIFLLVCVRNVVHKK